MITRNEQLLAIRPIITSIKISNNMSDDERFQNITLRPVIKLQHDLLIDIFRNYIAKHKNVFYELTMEKRMTYIDNVLHKDIKFRNTLKGLVIGQFTTEEYSLYIENSTSINKRIMNITIQRLQSSIQLFEKPKTLFVV